MSSNGVRSSGRPVPAVHRAWWGMLVKIGVAALLIAALASAWFRWVEPHEAAFERWLGTLGPWAPAMFVASVALALLLFLPKSLFSMAAGAIFGPLWGLVWMLTASFIAAIATFALVRRGFRSWVGRVLDRHPRLAAIDTAVGDRGTRAVVLLRMTPVGFAIMNWILAASRIRFREYLAGLVGLVPGTLSAVSIGFAARHTADLATRADDLPPGDSALREVGVYGSVAASVIVAVVVSRIAIRSIHSASATDGGRSDATSMPS